jgi:hypothetical protein
MDRDTLVANVSPPIDQRMAEQLIDEFISGERRFVLRDWGPATLDGGQLAEAASRILYHQDSGNLSHTRTVAKCLDYVEDPDNTNAHSYPDRKSALHTCKVLRTLYKFRSDRGAVHINPVYDANHLDSRLVIEAMRWTLSELLRVFWTGDRDVVAATIRELVVYEVPAVAVFDGVPLLQRIDCDAEEEVLLLLHYKADEGMTRIELGRSIPRPASTIAGALHRLTARISRQVVLGSNGSYRLTDLGTRRVLEELAEKVIS